MILYMFEQMTSRFGFNDGNSVPAEAEAYRDLLVRMINARLKDTNWEARAGSTSHNPTTIYFWNKSEDRVCDTPTLLRLFIEEVDDEDEDPIYNLITVTVTVDPNADLKIDSFVHWFDKPIK